VNVAWTGGVSKMTFNGRDCFHYNVPQHFRSTRVNPRKPSRGTYGGLTVGQNITRG
jgi:hypothetical protein